MRFGSVCSGIEAASVAWQPLGWIAAWLAEIEPFPCAVLAHHYPTVPNLGDMTRLTKRILLGEAEAPDVLCGGTPCQAFSVAGLRKSLDDDRGNLSLIFCEIADATDHVRARAGKPPAIVFWENVPGVLSTKDNARRLVACWNWCEGQETKGLELSIKIGRTAKDFIKEAYAKELTLISQRDELLKALKDALKEGIGWFDESCGGDADDLPWVIKARAAIAKVEGGGV